MHPGHALHSSLPVHPDTSSQRTYCTGSTKEHSRPPGGIGGEGGGGGGTGSEGGGGGGDSTRL